MTLVVVTVSSTEFAADYQGPYSATRVYGHQQIVGQGGFYYQAKGPVPEGKAPAAGEENTAYWQFLGQMASVTTETERAEAAEGVLEGEIDAVEASVALLLPKLAVSTQQGGAWTFALADAATVVEGTAGGGQTFTVPANAKVAFPVGTIIGVFQDGAGQITIKGEGGVTLRSDGAKVKTAAQYASVTLRQRAADEWCLAGDLA